jgi:hypothetical protein
MVHACGRIAPQLLADPTAAEQAATAARATGADPIRAEQRATATRPDGAASAFVAAAVQRAIAGDAIVGTDGRAAILRALARRAAGRPRRQATPRTALADAAAAELARRAGVAATSAIRLITQEHVRIGAGSVTAVPPTGTDHRTRTTVVLIGRENDAFPPAVDGPRRTAPLGRAPALCSGGAPSEAGGQPGEQTTSKRPHGSAPRHGEFTGQIIKTRLVHGVYSGAQFKTGQPNGPWPVSPFSFALVAASHNRQQAGPTRDRATHVQGGATLLQQRGMSTTGQAVAARGHRPHPHRQARPQVRRPAHHPAGHPPGVHGRAWSAADQPSPDRYAPDHPHRRRRWDGLLLRGAGGAVACWYPHSATLEIRPFYERTQGVQWSRSFAIS